MFSSFMVLIVYRDWMPITASWRMPPYGCHQTVIVRFIIQTAVLTGSEIVILNRLFAYQSEGSTSWLRPTPPTIAGNLLLYDRLFIHVLAGEMLFSANILSPTVSSYDEYYALTASVSLDITSFSAPSTGINFKTLTFIHFLLVTASLWVLITLWLVHEVKFGIFFSNWSSEHIIDQPKSKIDLEKMHTAMSIWLKFTLPELLLTFYFFGLCFVQSTFPRAILIIMPDF
jgi:hypothetical protein